MYKTLQPINNNDDRFGGCNDAETPQFRNDFEKQQLTQKKNESFTK